MKRQYCLYGRARLYPEGGSKGKSDFHALFLRQTPLQCIKPCTILKFLRSRRPPALDDWRLRKSNCPCRGVEMWRKEDPKSQGAGEPAMPPSAAIPQPSTASSAPAPAAAAVGSALPVSPRATACISQGIRIKGEITG